MLKKLIKYDFLKMFYVLPYFYVATLVFAGLTRLVNIWSDYQFMFILGQILQGTAIALMVNSFINALIGILIRAFRFSFYGDESYLTHTLPVSKSQLLLSKFISAVLILLSTFAVILLSLAIIFYSKEFVEIIKIALEASITGLNVSPILLIFLIAFAVFFQFLAMMLIGFASIVKGHSYNNGKISKSFLWFAIFYVASSVLSLIIIAFALLISGNITDVFSTVLKSETFLTLIISAPIIYTVYTLVFYLITHKLFLKGVNVD